MALPQTFHPVIRSWFTETFGNPTHVQAHAWPLIEKGENVLALAPTGSGKTLTAFLSAISRFCPAQKSDFSYDVAKLSVIYISPLKALNEDIKRNLLEPLAAIKARFQKEGLVFPDVTVETRSGDTPQSARRRFLIHPPSILALTPESLAIIILNPKGRQVLSSVKYVIIDEVHALIGNKRGSYLSCQIDRLASIAGEFQRISLSATVRNPGITAEFVGGLIKEPSNDQPGQSVICKPRKVNIVAPPAEKKIDFKIEFPLMENEIFSTRYTPIIDYILRRIWEGSTLLVFAESRRRAEKLCYFLNQECVQFFARNGNIKGRDFSGTVAFVHHGSLSKELRRSVEKGLAEGRIQCVVATASLELGIDIGNIDEVILAGSPNNVSQVLQRIGRSGHGVGQISRGRLFAFHGKDLLLAAALKSAVEDRDIEEIRPIENPLDILAQLILSLCAEKERNVEELYDYIKTFYIYRTLNKDSFNRVVRMLAGQGEKSRLRDIKPKIWFDKIEGKIGALDGTATMLYMSGGVIANRGLYSLRLSDGTKIGELDEEFVWERGVGDCFDFGAKGWRIASIGSESVEVIPLDKRADFIPFWKADIPFRSVNLTNRLLSLLDEYNRTSDICNGISAAAKDTLKSFLDLQRNMQKDLPLPDNKNIIIEIIKGNEVNRDFCSVVFHSFRGAQINYPLSLALSMELEESVKLRVASFSTDDTILFLIPRLGIEESSRFLSSENSVEELMRRALVSLNVPDKGSLIRADRLFRNRLESSGVFGAAFREAAERSLLLPKASFGKRTPLWIMRQRSKRLFDSVAAEDGFPVTAEAWRCCLVDTFDMDGFHDLISSINNGNIKVSYFHTNSPSAFSKDVVREETNTFMYEYDERKDLAGLKSASLSDKVIEDAVNNAALRPVLKTSTVDSFVLRLRREKAGYAPDDALTLGEWVKERIAIPVDEWKSLLGFIPAQSNAEAEILESGKISLVTRNVAGIASFVHREWADQWENDPLSLLGQWLRYEGPVSIERICEVFGVSAGSAQDAADALAEVDEVVNDVTVTDDIITHTSQPSSLNTINSSFHIPYSSPLTPHSSLLICDRENLEMILRLSRKKERPEINERPSSMLVPFLALRQGLTANDSSQQRRQTELMKNLYAWTAPVKMWETEILCARNVHYDAEKLNRALREGQLIWYGAGKERAGFCRPEDLDLVYEQKNCENSEGMAKLAASSFFNHPRDFWEIKNELASLYDNNGGVTQNVNSVSCAQQLWHQVWEGVLTSDSYEPVRRGIENGFIPKEAEMMQVKEAPQTFGRRARIPGALKNRWKGGAPVSGNWFSLTADESSSGISANKTDGAGNQVIAPLDPLEEDAINRDRVRLLLDRYGILCRPLLENESRVFSWSKLLPIMRRMELSGELVTGRFFSGINSLQFASASIAAELEQADNFSGLYWMNALDPASPAGLDIEGFDYKLCANTVKLPARSASNRMYFRGAALIAVSAKNGRDLHIYMGKDDPDIQKLIELFKIPRTRNVLPDKKILIEKINGESASRSSYSDCFKTCGFVIDRGNLVFW